MKRILLILIAVVVGGLALAHYKITSKVKEGLDNANRAMSMAGAGLKYGNVSVSLEGDVQVSDLNFHGPAGEQVRIDQMAMGTGNPFDLLNLTSQVQQQEIPEKAHVKIKGLTLDIDSPFLAQSEQESPGDNPLDAFGAVGCGNIHFIGIEEMKAMGYTEMRVNMDFNYELDGGGSRLYLTGNLESEGQGEMHLETVFNQTLSLNHLKFSPELVESVQLASARFSYRDEGYLTRTMELCARETGLDKTAYRDHHLDAWRKVWSDKLAVVPSDNVFAVYQDYIDHPGSTLTVEIEPYPPLDMDDNYLSSNPEYLSQRLNPRIGSNNQALAPFTVTPAASSATAAATAVEAHQTRAEQRTVEQAANDDSSLSISSLGQHLNEDVLLILTDGRTLDGRVQSVNAGKLLLRRHLYGGLMDVPVELRTIKAVRKQ